MKQLIFSMLLFLSSSSFADAFFSIGTTTNFKPRQTNYVQDDTEKMFIVSLNGVNSGTSYPKYMDKIGFSLSYAWGEYTFEERLFTHKNSNMFSIGFNFPIDDKLYFGISGSIYSSKTKFSTHDAPTVKKDDSETLTGYQFTFGYRPFKPVITSIGYNKTIDALLFEIGYQWH